MDRFQRAALKPLLVIPCEYRPYEYRDSVELLVRKDLRVEFDGNRYSSSA